MSAPTVMNSAFHRLQFWDGRASSLEDQAQGPVMNDVEMFAGGEHAWPKAVYRVRKKGDYTERFRKVFGTDPTRDGIAKAIATYERTVLNGNSVIDRAELAMRKRVDEEETGKYEFKPADFAKVLKAAFASKDVNALGALNLDPAKDAGKVAELAASLANGRVLFFGKARCNSCHVGDNLTDNDFHNLGVGSKDGVVPVALAGRYASLPTGQKEPSRWGAFKTPGVRGLLKSGPYMHDGSEKTLEQVVDFYDKGGNANEYLDVKMRDVEAEMAYRVSQEKGTPYSGPEVKLFGKSKTPVVPLPLKLTPQEKKDLVLFLRALEGEPVAPVVADRTR
jgi:cytochrome c peroxidase